MIKDKHTRLDESWRDFLHADPNLRDKILRDELVWTRQARYGTVIRPSFAQAFRCRVTLLKLPLPSTTFGPDQERLYLLMGGGVQFSYE